MKSVNNYRVRCSTMQFAFRCSSPQPKCHSRTPTLGRWRSPRYFSWFQRFDGTVTPRCLGQMVRIKPPNLGIVPSTLNQQKDVEILPGTSWSTACTTPTPLPCSFFGACRRGSDGLPGVSGSRSQSSHASRGGFLASLAWVGFSHGGRFPAMIFVSCFRSFLAK